MKKFSLALSVFFISALLTACQNKEASKKAEVDIYAFTKSYESGANEYTASELTLNELQKTTAKKIMSVFDLFSAQTNDDSFNLLKTITNEYKWDNKSNKSKNKENYNVLINDGSNIGLTFSYLKSDKIRQVEIWNLNEGQCNYIVNAYKFNSKVSTTVVNNSEEKAEDEDDNDLSNENQATCSDLNNDNKEDIILIIEKNDKVLGRLYPNFNAEIVELTNKNYLNAISTYDTNIWFTEKPIQSEYFYDGVDYMVNPKNNHVFAGALNLEQCKTMIYNLPKEINYKINDKNECVDSLNTIEFFKKG
jgi:hypothetical protein